MNAKKLIVADLHQGLGNQLFQYTAALGLASDLDADLAFRSEAPSGDVLGRVLGLDVPAVTPSMLRRSAILAEDKRLRQRMALAARRRWLTARGRQLRLHPAPLDPRPPDIRTTDASFIHMVGYFQDASWFGRALPEVAAQLRTSLRAQPAADLGRGSTVISFRRGDFVKLGWGLPLLYYERSAALLSETPGPTWVISDDAVVAELSLGWFRSLGIDARTPPRVPEGGLLRDLGLLSTASQVVMSNSSYCWWGVVAGDLDPTLTDRTIFAPVPWNKVAPASWAAETGGLLRPGWRTVEQLQSDPPAQDA
jgi:hypothetical protein